MVSHQAVHWPVAGWPTSRTTVSVAFFLLLGTAVVDRAIRAPPLHGRRFLPKFLDLVQIFPLSFRFALYFPRSISLFYWMHTTDLLWIRGYFHGSPSRRRSFVAAIVDILVIGTTRGKAYPAFRLTRRFRSSLGQRTRHSRTHRQ